MGSSSGSDAEDGPESRPKMLKRHKKEVLAAQKAAQRLGKKRAEEGATLLMEVNMRHAAELAALEAGADGGAKPAPASDATEPAVGAAATTQAPAAEAAASALAAASLGGTAPQAPEAGGKARQLAHSRVPHCFSCF